MDKLKCPKCGGENMRKNGWQSRGDERFQNYLCKGCAHQWQPDKPPLEHEYAKSNEARRKFNEKTYKSFELKFRHDEFSKLIGRMEKYAKMHPEKGAVQKRMREVLDKHF